MFFDGVHHKKRVVAIRGKSQQAESAHSLVEQNRRAREQREYERKRNQAATRIQQWWRRQLAQSRELDQIHQEWATLIGQFHSRPNSEVPTKLYLDIVTRFTFFYRSGRTKWTHSLVETAKLIGISIQGRTGESFTSQLLRSADGTRFLQLLPRLLASFTRKLIRNDGHLDEKTQTLIIVIINYFCVPDCYTGVALLDPERYIGQLVSSISRVGLSGHFNKILKQAPILTARQSEPNHIKFVARLTGISLYLPDKMKTLQYLIHIASIPGLEHRIPSEYDFVISKLSWAHFDSLGMEDAVYICQEAKKQSLTAGLNILITLFQFLKTQQQPPKLSSLRIILFMSYHFLAAVPYGLIIEGKSVSFRDGLSESKMHELDALRPSLEEIASHSQKKLSLLYDRQVLMQLYEWSRDIPSIDDTKGYLFNIYKKAISLFPRNVTIQLTVTLIFHTNFLQSAWEFSQLSNLLDIFQEKPGNVEIGLLRASVFGFFCRVYESYLTLADDHEFYEENPHLSLDQNAQLMILLRDLVYTKLMSVNALHETIMNDYSHWIALLQQLTNRNLRREFCAAERLILPNTALAGNRGSQSEKFDLILKHIPFVIPFAKRVEIFQSESFREMQRNRFVRGGRIRIRRDHFIDDAIIELERTAMDDHIQVEFIDSNGLTEPGVDGGGLFKEFISELSSAIFDPQRGLFKETHEHFVYPNPTAFLHDPTYNLIKLAGKVTGMAIQRSIHFHFKFAPFFLSKILGKKNSFDLLSTFDADIAQNLIKLKKYDNETLESLYLYFTVSQEEYGMVKEIDLVPNGKEIQVNGANVRDYVKNVSDYYLNRSINPQCQAFLAGLSSTFDLKNLKLFNERELSMLFSGVEADIDVDDWRRNTQYGGASDNDPIIVRFWDVVRQLSTDDKRMLLKFVTSSDCAPLLGFGHLQPRFTINLIPDEDGALPTASTCINLLKLRPYSTDAEMKEKILLAIHNASGFYLA